MKRLLKNGTVVNVFTGELIKTNVLFENGIILGVDDYGDGASCSPTSFTHVHASGWNAASHRVTARYCSSRTRIRCRNFSRASFSLKPGTTMLILFFSIPATLHIISNK